MSCMQDLTKSATTAAASVGGAAKPIADRAAREAESVAEAVAEKAKPAADEASKQIEQGAKTIAEKAKPAADEASKQIEGAARDVAKQAKPTADKASEQLNQGAKKASGAHQRSYVTGRACQPLTARATAFPSLDVVQGKPSDFQCTCILSAAIVCMYRALSCNTTASCWRLLISCPSLRSFCRLGQLHQYLSLSQPWLHSDA